MELFPAKPSKCALAKTQPSKKEGPAEVLSVYVYSVYISLPCHLKTSDKAIEIASNAQLDCQVYCNIKKTKLQRIGNSDKSNIKKQVAIAAKLGDCAVHFIARI